MLFLVVLSTITLAHGSVIPHVSNKAVKLCVGFDRSVPQTCPQPYKFGYSIKDHHGEQHRQKLETVPDPVVGNYGFH
ncbi:hypothetical protein CDAR_391471 [Caerostris darwini]|uniref:Uncharacterized protein n=1 Tax=Caerostris darwini TaxID=1538125 RepID=A0AAV4NET3_9ARAC|nr:hypothetical protein CDAR_391471 [Caerostris darwini]